MHVEDALAERGRRRFEDAGCNEPVEEEGVIGEEVGWGLESDVARELALEMRAYAG
jgi:hypothetical protein